MEPHLNLDHHHTTTSYILLYLQHLYSTTPPPIPTTTATTTLFIIEEGVGAWWQHLIHPILRLLIPAFLLLVVVATATVLLHWSSPGGNAWGRLRSRSPHSPRGTDKEEEEEEEDNGDIVIPGPRGLPILGHLLVLRHPLAHVRLSAMAASANCRRLMAFSLGHTPAVLTCSPHVAREILASPSFADRPLKSSARHLLFHRAIGFAPYGPYWRNLRRVAATHLFSPRQIAAHEPLRQRHTSDMIRTMDASMERCGWVAVRSHLQHASLSNIMGSVFGVQDYRHGMMDDLEAMVREGFDLLGEVNFNDHLDWFWAWFDRRSAGVERRSRALAARVKVFVQKLIDEKRRAAAAAGRWDTPAGHSDFIDVLLSLSEEEKLSDEDMIAVLWEMIFRGADTTAVLTEWVLAEMALNPEIQRRVQAELEEHVAATGGEDGLRGIAEAAGLGKLPYLQAVIKEALRLHPPGPLLSWARLAVVDVEVAGYRVPAGTTAMVNMWAITHDAEVWADAGAFRPERFLEEEVDVRGGDLRLAPFGAGRRVCPGRALGYATVQLWVASLLYAYTWLPHPSHPVHLAEHLKLSCEMKCPLRARALRRHHHASASSST